MKAGAALLVLLVALAAPTVLHAAWTASRTTAQPEDGPAGDDLEAQRQQIREQAAEYNRKSALEQRRRKAESAAPEATPEPGRNLGIGYLFSGVALAALIGLVLYLLHRARSPQVHCPRCSWSGRKSEAAQLGQASNQGDDGELVFMPGEVSIAAELIKAATGASACPRCGAHPLLDARRVAPPLPPRKAARPRPHASRD